MSIVPSSPYDQVVRALQRDEWIVASKVDVPLESAVRSAQILQ